MKKCNHVKRQNNIINSFSIHDQQLVNKIYVCWSYEYGHSNLSYVAILSCLLVEQTAHIGTDRAAESLGIIVRCLSILQKIYIHETEEKQLCIKF